MQILSHRGFWKNEIEKNTAAAFNRSFQFGFGTETDIRDFSGEVVVSHDPPTHRGMPFAQFLEYHSKFEPQLPLALNIKSDGLQGLIRKLVERFQVSNYFVFDMSIPDTLNYARCEIPFYCRQSEYEPIPSLYEMAEGVWLDCFERDWYDSNLIMEHLKRGKRVCLVSPELHGRNRTPLWSKLKEQCADFGDEVLLCTDFPEEARCLFNEQD